MSNPLFVRIIRVRKGTPLFHTAPSIDVDERTHQCRVCSSSLILRVFSRGIVLGWWQPSDMAFDDSLKELLRCGLNEPPSIWGQF
jgi:hypothetical protein